MKVRIVDSSELSQQTLRATHYVDPTRDVDAQIARAEKVIEDKRAWLVKLHEERERLLSEHVDRRLG